MLHELHYSLARRLQPEDVAQLILQGMGDSLSPAELKVLRKATVQASRTSSMPLDFWKPATIERQAKVAAALIPAVAPHPADAPPETLLGYVGELGQAIARRLGDTDFKQHRLNREARRRAGLGDMSKRQYNKRFRLLQRMERKAHTLAREWTKADLARIAKSRLACRLTPEDLGTDLDTAAFVAYLTATLNRRSVFTAGSQERAFDEIADLLLKRVKASSTANWWAVAHVQSDADIVARLTDERKGRLLGMWHAALVAAAGILQSVYTACTINRQTMVVQRPAVAPFCFAWDAHLTGDEQPAAGRDGVHLVPCQQIRVLRQQLLQNVLRVVGLFLHLDQFAVALDQEDAAAHRSPRVIRRSSASVDSRGLRNSPLADFPATALSNANRIRYNSTFVETQSPLFRRWEYSPLNSPWLMDTSETPS